MAIYLVLILFYVGLVLGVIYLKYTWINKFISLKQEHNDLLREIIKGWIANRLYKSRIMVLQ